ncbi:hypothetical protein BDFB_008974 [Asbolus verrucosus]|uniref:H15 domain-containing protein n=1 Tax=Asbolus verrucosus TaxID=1661398 RepID=A0A482W0Y3_ASBVE|nr:hypothetical protein BDFB_008974 [Asbolus verrucosus]
MKRPLRPPRYFLEVLQAIYELKEIGGSNSDKIVSRVKEATSNANSSSKPRNISTQVRRALKYAISNGIVKQRAGKFRINLKMLNPFKDCAECRRRKRRTKRRQRRRRRHSLTPCLESGFSSRSDSDIEDYKRRERSSSPDEIPAREVRRRRRKDMIYLDDHNSEEGPRPDGNQCGNPECLCNVKEEINEMKKDSM